MALILIIIGVIMVIAAARNTVSGNSNDLIPLVQSDFTGKDNYLYWIVAIMIIGGMGYIPSMKNLSNGFLVLVLLGLFLSNGGFFSQFNTAINSTQTASAQTASSTNSLSSILGGIL